MTHKSLRTLGWSVVVVLSLLLAACGASEGQGDGDIDGDCDCPDGLDCVAGDCVCLDANCCLASEDCQAGKICNRATHRCEERDPVVDGDQSDGDSDGDQPDGDVDGDQPDGDVDGDQPDGDADGDATDGDADGDIPQRSCMWGVEKLLRVEDLPLFERQVVTRQYSSRDPAEGNDDMRPEGLYLDGQDQVLLHSEVPGCVYRMWFAEPQNIGHLRLKMYFDGETTPSINRMITDFFDDTSSSEAVSPFLQPLVGIVNGKNRGAYYSYVPICWSDSIKIVASGLSKGWQITYQELPDCPDIETFTMDLDVSELLSLATEGIGEDPKPTGGNTVWTSSRPLNAGAAITVYEEHISQGQPGKTINAFKLDIAGVNDDILNNAWIQIYWDGKDILSEPDVEVPIGLFFGSGYGEVDWSGLMTGISTSGMYYSYWPMPYWRSVIIRVNNLSQSNIAQMDFELHIAPNIYPRDQAGNFRARYQEEIPTTSGRDYVALEEGGKGRVVGITMAMEPIIHTGNNAFLHGDERFFIDGMRFPVIRGTGTDNFFNGHYLWQVDGYNRPWFSVQKGNDYRYTAHRVFLGDSIPFNQNVRLGFEHGGTNTDNGYYRSVVYYYSSCLAGMQLTDEVCFGVTAGTPCSEDEHQMTISLESNLDLHRNVPGAYEGEDHQTTTVDSGRGIMSAGSTRGLISLVLNIDPKNEGVRLIRKLSHKLKSDANRLPRQGARVLVGRGDAQLNQLTEVGTWFTPGTNYILPWKESIFDIPPALTAGKSSIKVAFEHTGQGTEWNVFNLWVYSLLPPGDGEDGPGKVMDTSYQMVGLKPCLSWNVPQGVPPTTYHIYRSSAQAFNCEGVPLASTSETEWCEPESLAAQSEFYYRIMAEDCTGMRGPCSDRLRVYTGLPPVCFEAEDTFNSESSLPGPDAYSERLNPNYSGNKLVVYQATAINHRLVLNYTLVPAEATYQIQVTFMKGPNMGIVRFRIGGSVLDDVDLYAAEESLVALTFGPRSIAGGSRSFEFVVTGKNAASSGYDIAVDKICLLGINEGE